MANVRSIRRAVRHVPVALAAAGSDAARRGLTTGDIILPVDNDATDSP